MNGLLQLKSIFLKCADYSGLVCHSTPASVPCACLPNLARPRSLHGSGISSLDWASIQGENLTEYNRDIFFFPTKICISPSWNMRILSLHFLLSRQLLLNTSVVLLYTLSFLPLQIKLVGVAAVTRWWQGPSCTFLPSEHLWAIFWWLTAWGRQKRADGGVTGAGRLLIHRWDGHRSKNKKMKRTERENLAPILRLQE